jgi:DNA polymerase I-like protein with 3'-5' exonuclease and polymerase domains
VCFHKELTAKKIPFKLVAWVHDEVQIEVPEKYGTIVGEIVVKAAADAGEILKFRCPVGAEFKTGKNWYDCH